MRSRPSSSRLLHKLIDGGTQLIDGGGIAGGDSIHHAVAQVILQNHLARIVQRGADSSQLHQHLGTIVAALYHPLDLLEMTDGPGQTVDHCLLIFVDMAVGVGDAVGMHIGMIVFVSMLVMLVMMIIMGMLVIELLMLVCHSQRPFRPVFC